MSILYKKVYLHPVRINLTSGCSVARLSRLLWEQEVAGSNPATPTNLEIGSIKTLLIV